MIFVLPLAVIGLAIAGAAITVQPWRILVFVTSIFIAMVVTLMHLA